MQKYNFGNLHYSIKQHITENLEENKPCVKKYFDLIKSSKVLSEQFNLYDNLQKQTTLGNDTKQFVLENFEWFNTTLDKKQILKENQKLVDFCNDNKIEIKEDTKQKPLFESIDKMLLLKKTPSNAVERLNGLTTIVESINSRELIKENTDSNLETLLSEHNVSKNDAPAVMVELLKSTYGENLTETESKIIKSIVTENIDEQKSIFDDVKVKCLSMINEKLKDCSDIEIKESLLNGKEQLLNASYNKETFVENITQMNSIIKADDSVEDETFR